MQKGMAMKICEKNMVLMTTFQTSLRGTNFPSSYNLCSSSSAAAAAASSTSSPIYHRQQSHDGKLIHIQKQHAITHLRTIIAKASKGPQYRVNKEFQSYSPDELQEEKETKHGYTITGHGTSGRTGHGSTENSRYKAFRRVFEKLVSKKKKKKKKGSPPYIEREEENVIIIDTRNGSSQWKLREEHNEKKKKKNHVGIHDGDGERDVEENRHVWCPYLECVFGLLLCLFSFQTRSNDCSGLLPSVLLLTSWWYMAAQFRFRVRE